MRHGDRPYDPVNPDPVPPDDPALANVYADMGAYLLLERALCSCEALCTCGWDDK